MGSSVLFIIRSPFRAVAGLPWLSLHPAHDHADNHPVYPVMAAITAAHVTHIFLSRILPPMRAAALPALHHFSYGVLLWLSAHYLTSSGVLAACAKPYGLP
jgi:hypothetical protein